MDWILLGVLGIVWMAYVFPTRARHGRARSSVDQFERDMGLLEQTEKATGRWIVAPRKGEPFVGRQQRARARVRDRRRKILVFLLEALALTLLIGIFPPLHGMWILSGALFLVLAGYVWLLVEFKAREAARPRLARAEGSARVDVPLGPAAPDPDEELPWLRDGDMVHVRVHTARDLELAGIPV